MDFVKKNKWYVLAGSIVLVLLIVTAIWIPYSSRTNKSENKSEYLSQSIVTPSPYEGPKYTPAPSTNAVDLPLLITPTGDPNPELPMWSFDGTAWISSKTPPACVEPLSITTPVNLSFATNVLYPGQTRSGDFKPHGGFRFDGKKNSDITVTLPVDASIYRGARYIETGETQYLFDFITPCGIFFRFDHLLTLSPKYQEIAETLPPATNESRTTVISKQGVKGEAIAVAVGFQKTKNTSVDFGVYDIRKPNEISKNATWAAAHKDEQEQSFYAICWLNYLEGSDSAKAKSLPGSGTEGKKSDYCK